MSKLSGKVAIVTGASKGIGAGIAKAMAAEGARVVVNYASSKEDADKVVAEIARDGGQAVAVHADVSKEADVVRLFDETRRAFDRVDAVVPPARPGRPSAAERGRLTACRAPAPGVSGARTS